MVAGDLVNTASRVQSAAEPGTVLVGESTRRATEQTIVYEDAGRFELKGKERADAAVAGAARSSRGGAGRSSRRASRRRSSAATASCGSIKELFHASADERRAHLVSVDGHRRDRQVAARVGVLQVLRRPRRTTSGGTAAAASPTARASPTGRSRTWCGCAAGSPRTRTGEPRRAKLARDARGARRRRGASARSSSRGSRSCSGSASASAATGRTCSPPGGCSSSGWPSRYPMVLVFEDMQWADAAPARLRRVPARVVAQPPALRDHARPARAARAAARPGARASATSPRSTSSRSPARRWSELLDGLVPGLPDEAARRRSSPAPRACRSTRSRRCGCCSTAALLVQDGAVYRPVGEIESLEVPETLHALIAARLDGLAAEERRLLQDGAGARQDVHAARALAALVGSRRGGDRAAARWRSSARRCSRSRPTRARPSTASTASSRTSSATSPTRRSRSASGGRGTSRPRRTSRRACIDEDEVAEVIASHYLAAYEAAPDADDAAEIRAQARDGSTRAGERAASLAAAAEAQRVLRAGRRARRRARPSGATLLDRAGQMALRGGRARREARALLERAHRDSSRPRASTQRAARVSAPAAPSSTSLEGHAPQAVARLEPALADARRATSRTRTSRAVAGAARPLPRLRAATREAAPHVERALELAEALDLPEVLAEALNTKALAAPSNGRLERGADPARGRPRDRARARPPLGGAARLQQPRSSCSTPQTGSPSRSSSSEQALALARRVGDREPRRSTFAGVYSMTSGPVGRGDAVSRSSRTQRRRPRRSSSLVDVIFVHTQRGHPSERAGAWSRRGGPERPAGRSSGVGGTERSSLLRQRQARRGRWASRTARLPVSTPGSRCTARRQARGRRGRSSARSRWATPRRPGGPCGPRRASAREADAAVPRAQRHVSGGRQRRTAPRRGRLPRGRGGLREPRYAILASRSRNSSTRESLECGPERGRRGPPCRSSRRLRAARRERRGSSARIEPAGERVPA